MHILPSTQNSYSPNFERFIKVKGSAEDISSLQNELRNYSDDLITLTHKKRNDKSVLYILTGKTFDKFIDLIPKVWFRQLRTNIEKYIGEKPEKLKLKTLKQKLNSKQFTV